MAVFDFTVTGQVEVDEDALGVVVANKVRTQPGGQGELDVESGFHFRLDPSAALNVVLRQAVLHEMEANFSHVGWKPHQLDATVERVSD